ncbi:amidohydrolase family protein [Micromonospora carbonacea]|uniref:Amidohydrolase n=1 Tax=Micromonospora carbonacea TaxID=47853 RepID=A0A7H8XLS5_9ACTN|nr:amidohydrolase family protein [Micromonospora carbonacea]MBB5825925.1 aminocarboxymuconate-semialdehyde decarboxylase [Micromonospora carbonacea]QLD25518.1 amidohydrolase [Micromonospora carbonacea]
MTIDVHGHISPPESMSPFPMPPSLRDVPGMIERKLAVGIELTVVGSPVGAGAMVPVAGVDNYAQPTDRLRAFHDWLAGQVAAHPRHLRALVYANPFGDDEHLACAAQTYRDGAFVGFVINTSVAGRYLDDPAAGQFFAMADELEAPVLLHAPAQPAAGTGLTDHRLLEQLGRFCDVTIGVGCCVLGGWLEKFPGLRLVATGAGGALALLAEKLDLIYAPPQWARGGGAPAAPLPLSRPPSEYLRALWVDTASPSARALRANLEVFGADRILLGTDSPPLVGMESPVLAAIDGLPVPEEDRRAIREGNAKRLFRL